MPPTPISTGINLNDVPVWDGNNYVSAPVPTGHTHGQLIATGSNCTLGIVTTTNLVATGSSPTFGIVTTTNLVATGSSPTFTNRASMTSIKKIVASTPLTLLRLAEAVIREYDEEEMEEEE